jgi:methionyl-tRNA synthetase
MNQEQNKFYVTTPIYYVTAKPHLGHLYSTVIADVLARWNKLQGKKIFFLTGTDEFGQKIAHAAQKAGKEPQEFVDSFIDAYKKIWQEYEINYSIFMRTTNEFHIKAVQEWIKLLMKKGDIYKSFYSGWYCIPDEAFITEQEVSKTPPLCPTCGRETVYISEEAYFFKLSAYQDKLLKFYEDNPDFIIPKERSHEVINFVKSGLKDLSISRTTVKWGVPFPGDPNHVTYVWADALNNYITAIGWGQKGKEKEFNYWWPADIQVMGKDIVRFHAIYWPAFLMAADLQPPKHLLVHGWFKVGAQKMSKSLGNVIDPQTLFDAYGADEVRYYLMKQLAITHDGEFSIDDLEQKISSDLADDLGNLLNRMVTLAHKYDVYESKPTAIWSSEALALRNEAAITMQEFQMHMDECMFHLALSRLWRFISQINAYFHAQEPWKVAKKDMALFKEIISATSHCLYQVGLLLWPVMPKKMEQMLESLGWPLDGEKYKLEIIELGIWNKTFMLKKIENLFSKPIVKEESEKAQPNSVEASSAPTISFDEFAKVHLNVGTIEQCEEIPSSDKLYKLQVDFGKLGKRQILSGIRKFFTKEDLIGKQAVFVTNLKPRTMLGLESQGMLLTAKNAEGKINLIIPTNPVENGTQLQ